MTSMAPLLTLLTPQSSSAGTTAATPAAEGDGAFGLALQQAEAQLRDAIESETAPVPAETESHGEAPDEAVSAPSGSDAGTHPPLSVSVSASVLVPAPTDSAPLAQTLPALLREQPPVWQRPTAPASDAVPMALEATALQENTDADVDGVVGTPAASGVVPASASSLPRAAAVPGTASGVVEAEAPDPAPAPAARTGADPATTARAEPDPASPHAPGARPAAETAADTDVPVATHRAVTTVAAPISVPVPATQAAAPELDTVSVPPRTVAAQVAPALMSIVQRPAGTHQLTMTISPDTLGPVTIRAHIGAGGDVRVELLGGTESGREALRTIVVDLRRDLAAVMPTAQLSLSSAATSDLGANDRGGQPGAPGTDSGARGEDRPSERGRTGEAFTETPEPLRSTLTMNPIGAAPGAGLDTFA